MQQLKSGFRRTINCHTCQSKVTLQEPNPHLDYLIDPSFQGVKRFRINNRSFRNNTDTTIHIKYYLPTVEIKDYDVMIDLFQSTSKK